MRTFNTQTVAIIALVIAVIAIVSGVAIEKSIGAI
jgi:hypothetical protein